MIDLSLIKLIPADESHREFSYQVKKEAEGDYITQFWGWDEIVQRNFHTKAWQEKRPQIILYDNQPIGTISVVETEDYIEIGQFFILPEYQNKGIGSHLLKRILDKADQSSRITKIAYLINNPVASLYKRNGFEITNIHEVYCHMERKPSVTIKHSRKYKAVIFDLFGTLVNIFSRTEYEKTLVEMAAILKAPYDDFEEIWYKTASLRATGDFSTLDDNIEYMCRELKITVSKNQVKRACQARYKLFAFFLTPKPDAIETIAQLKSGGYKIGLISNCSTEPPVIWPDTPFAPLFDAAIFSSTSGVQKPDPRIYRLATEKLAVKPENCLYIGDGDGNELTGATEVGMHPVLIRNPGEDKQSVMRTGYQGDSWDGAVINSLKEVLDLIKQGAR